MPNEEAGRRDFPYPLHGRTQTMGRTETVSVLFFVVFGLVFSAAGAAVTGVALGWIPSEDAHFHAPRWVIACNGLAFFAIGLGIQYMGLRGPFLQARLTRLRRRYPNQPAMWDHPWNAQGASQPRIEKVLQSWLFALGLTAFLMPFNWWAFFSDDDTFMVKLLVGFFDLFLILAWWGVFYTLVWALKFGPARLTWDSFPVRREAVFLRWTPGRGLEDWSGGTFVLRCLREKRKSPQPSQDENSRILHECLWEEARSTGGPRMGASHGAATLAFSLPEHAPGTAICADPPVYWELEVKIPRRGVDFQHRYLVPIYA